MNDMLWRSCHPGERLALDMDSCAVLLPGSAPARLVMPPPQAVFTVPQAAPCRLVSLREVRLTAGFCGLGCCHVPMHAQGDVPRDFPLGFYAQLSLRAAHMQGLAHLLRRFPEAGGGTLLPLLESETRPALRRALRRALGPEPWIYGDVLQRRQLVQSAAEDALFDLFFTYGLCLRPRSLIIQGFAKPAL